MDIRNRRGLKEAARESLANASYNPTKLVLIHTLAAVALALTVTILDLLLGDRIADTGGLGGLGLRSILSTIQSVLRLANMVLLPFWEVGYIYAAMNIARGKEAGPASLLEGLRRWSVVLRSNLLQIILYFCTGMACYYVSMTVFLMTPMSGSLQTLVAPYLNDPNALLADPALSAAVMEASIPMFLIFLALFVILALPMVYHFRLVNYALLDNPKAGAFAALRRSKFLMHGDRFNLFRLDLSFWWFYALDLLVTLVAYSDTILQLLGVQLSADPAVIYFGVLVLYSLCQLALYWKFRAPVEVTYAAAYDQLSQPQQAQEAQPQNQPWTY